MNAIYVGMSHAYVPSASYKCRMYMYDLHVTQWPKIEKNAKITTSN